MSPFSVLAYKTNTHEALTHATIQAYERLHSGTFVSLHEQEVVNGSSGEDASSRPIYHFYDPINRRGLSVWTEFEASKYWAQDTQAQGNYNCWGVIVCFGSHLGYDDKFFSSPTDYSWDRAVYEYVYGDKLRAAETLGHILHLLQDSTVPAHVRNDPHLNHNGFGDADPYEEFTGQFSQVAVPDSLQTPNFAGLSEAFDITAEFTNKNFLSKDTLFVSYASPNLSTLKQKDNYVYDSSGNYRVARFESKFIRNRGLVTDWFINDPQGFVLGDYWRILSKKAIEGGVEVIDLFFREVENERQVGALKAKNISQAEQDLKNAASKSFRVVKKLYGSSLNQEEYDELLGASVATAPVFEEQVGATAPAARENPGVVAGEETEIPQALRPETPQSQQPQEVQVPATEPIPNLLPLDFSAPVAEPASAPEPPPAPQSSPSTGGALHEPPPPPEPASDSATSTATSTPDTETSTTTNSTSDSTATSTQAATSTAATTTPSLTTSFTESPFEDSFDNFNSLGWSEINARYYATTSADCSSDGCIQGQTGNNIISKTGAPVLEGGFTIRGKKHFGFRAAVPDIFISSGLATDGESMHILDDIPDDDTWHQFAIFWREGPGELKEFCLLRDQTDPLSCSWFDTKVIDTIANGIPIDTIRLDANVGRSDLGDAVWWDELRKP